MKDYNPLHIICFLTILEIAEKNKAEFVYGILMWGVVRLPLKLLNHGLFFFFPFNDTLPSLQYYVCSLLGAPINHQMHIPH